MVSCPTGALTNRGVAGTTLAVGTDTALTPEELHKLPVFAGVSGTFLELNRGAIVKRRFRKGDVICREGDFGSTAFYILEGKAQVSISTPIAHVKTEGGALGLFKKLKSSLVGREEDKRVEETRDRTIPIDASVDLAYGNPVAELGPGDLFGEMTCMNFYPRSATVRAESDVAAYEMLRNVLDIMQKNKTFRAQVDQNYRRPRPRESSARRADVLRTLARFHHAPERKCRARALRSRPVIARQGDPADSFYLVRIGFVKNHRGIPRRRTRPRLSLARRLFRRNRTTRRRPSYSNLHRLDHVEVVKISGDDFRQMVERFPNIRAGLENIAAERRAANEHRLQMVERVPLDQFLSQGLMEAQSC